jgi:hypothetical protein
MGVTLTQITLLQFVAQWHAFCRVFEYELFSIVVRTILIQLNGHYAHCCVTITRRNILASHDARLPQFVTKSALNINIIKIRLLQLMEWCYDALLL